MENKTKKLDNISFIKTMMMITVVAYHSMIFFGGTWFPIVAPAENANYLYFIAKWMNTFHIQVFTMASGYLFYYLREKRHTQQTHRQAILKRAKRLLIPYLSVCVIWVIPIACYFFNYSTKEIIHKYILGESPSQLWFLLMLFIVFSFFEIIGHKIKVSTKNLVVITVITTIIGLALSKLNINYYQIARAIQFILYFYLGEYIYKYRKTITAKQAIIMTISAILLYVIFTILETTNLKYIDACNACR